MTITGAQSIDTEVTIDDVADDVRAAFESVRTIEGTATDITEPAAAETDPSAPPADRVRNERGQFIAKTEDGAEPAATPPAPVPDADPNPATPAQPSTAVETPKTWSADAKAEWSKLSPAVQQAVLKRETEINEGGRQWSEEKRSKDELIAPLKNLGAMFGVDERETIKRLLAAEHSLRTNPEAALRDMAQMAGIDLKALADKTPQQPQRPQADPMVAQLHQDVSSLKNTLAEQSKAETSRTIQAFAKSPGHEHFEAVKQRMGRFMLPTLNYQGQVISNPEAADLQEAYDKACWMDPDVRAKLVAAQTATTAAAQKAIETTQKARRGAVSPRTSSSAPAPAVPPPHKLNGHATGDSVEDDVRAAFRSVRS